MWQIFLLLICCTACTSASAASTKSKPANVTPSTCPSRTVNYITHGLPQLCLPSSRRIQTYPASVDFVNNSAPNGLNYTEAHSTAKITTSLKSAFQNQTQETSEFKSSATTNSSGIINSTSVPSSSSSSASAPQSNISPNGVEDESPLEDAKFLSFEDWKKVNLQKVGQSEHVGKHSKSEAGETRKRPTSGHSALDSIGDDAEIDLDFSGLVPDGPKIATAAKNKPLDQSTSSNDEVHQGITPKARSRSEDAGTTCKERFNYASFDCAANMLKTNPEAQSASSVLVENKDAYMLNECSAENKFMILELCDDISIDTIVLSNFEFFSSIFRTFRVSVSDKYPVKIDKWKTLGVFEARNSRDVQAFLVENPVIWARYLRIEFLTHYGNEFYCPVSLVRVHGTTMLEEYKHDLDSLQAEEDDENDLVDQSSGEADILLDSEPAKEYEQDAEDVPKETSSQFDAQPQRVEFAIAMATENETTVSNTISGQVSPTEPPSSKSSEYTNSTTDVRSAPTCDVENHIPPNDNWDEILRFGNKSFPYSTSKPISSTQNNTEPNRPTLTHQYQSGLNSTLVSNSTSKNSESHHNNQKLSDSNSTLVKPTTNSTSSERVRASPTSTQTQTPVPTMQESFFKSVQKRLQMLESNSSLSLQYIEDQSRALRDAFNKMEHRQSTKTMNFIEYLNTTVLNELRDFRQQYDQLWQSTVIELETQRERYQKENVAIDARLAVLTEELIFQKRISILQMLLICICLALVIFSKGSLNDYLEIPLVQSVLSRSPSSRWLNSTHLETPSDSPGITRTTSAPSWRRSHGILKGHRRTQSEESADSVYSPTEIYSPPTPASYGDVSDTEQSRDEDRLDSSEFDPEMIERPSTSPPILPSTDLPITMKSNIERIEDSIHTRLVSDDTPLRGPKVVIEDATPTPKHLTWKLPES